MHVTRNLRKLQLALACLFFPGWAIAGSILDYIRDYDLNDYALGVAVSVDQNPYVGAESSTVAFPILTSFSDSALTDDWVLLEDGDIGARWISQNGWELAGVVRLQTLGLGNSDSSELLGIADRKWTVEAAPSIGWRGWPVQFKFKTYAEISDRHDGLISELSVSLPVKWSRGYFVPSVEATYLNSNYTNYYYAVTVDEATGSRPAYQPGAASNWALKARWGYELSKKWLLAGSIGFERLDSVIADSPIVGRDDIWSAQVSLAYNADVFQSRSFDDTAPELPSFSFRVGAFQDSVSTKVVRDTANGVPGFEADFEDLLGAPNENTALQVDAIVRLGHHHRLEFGYFGLGRSSTIVLSSDVTIGDELFPAGTTVDTRVDAKIFQAVYSYSLIRDAQKELAITAGVHFAEFEADISSTGTGQTERSSVGTPLPVIGAQASIFMSDKMTIGAKLQIFRTDFHHYEGSLNYGALDLQYRLGNASSIGVGYNFYGMKLSSRESDLNGYLKIRHHGPVAFFTVGY